jgi:uncharacterized protein
MATALSVKTEPGATVAVESPFFFQADSRRLFGVLHLPEGVACTRGIVMCHPFGEEKLWSHRVFVSCARALAARGYAVLRFDFTGAGDSAGDTADTSLEIHLGDLAAAVREITARCPGLARVGLLGLRLGASYAALFCERMATDSRFTSLHGGPLVMWECVTDGDAYFMELLRSNMATQMAVYGEVRDNRETLMARIRSGVPVNVDGYDIGKPLLESAGRADLLSPSATLSHAGPVLVVQIAASPQQKPRDDLQNLASRYTRGTLLRAGEQPFWREIKPFYGRALELQRVTLEWLEQNDV